MVAGCILNRSRESKNGNSGIGQDRVCARSRTSTRKEKVNMNLGGFRSGRPGPAPSPPFAFQGPDVLDLVPMRRTLGRLWMLLVFVPTASAAVACLGGVASVPVLDPSSVSAAVGHYTLTCSGGGPVFPLPTIGLTAYLNVAVLLTPTPILTDGVNSYTGVVDANTVQFLDVFFDPVGISFEFENIFVDPSSQPPGFQFLEEVSATGPVSVPILDAQQIVAVNGSVPEPSTFPLAGIALSAVALLARRRTRVDGRAGHRFP